MTDLLENGLLMSLSKCPKLLTYFLGIYYTKEKRIVCTKANDFDADYVGISYLKKQKKYCKNKIKVYQFMSSSVQTQNIPTWHRCAGAARGSNRNKTQRTTSDGNNIDPSVPT